MKMMLGLFSRARLKSCFTNLYRGSAKAMLVRGRACETDLCAYRSDSPIHLLTKSDELTEKKVLFASVATALARYDFPVPGGP